MCNNMLDNIKKIRTPECRAATGRRGAAAASFREGGDGARADCGLVVWGWLVFDFSNRGERWRWGGREDRGASALKARRRAGGMAGGQTVDRVGL